MLVMFVIYLFGFFLAQNVGSATSRSRPARKPRPTPVLIQGDIVVPEEHRATGEDLSAFLKNPSALWPSAIVNYRLGEDEWDGVYYPLFMADQVKNITEAHKRIMEAVPCIRFR